MHPLPAPLAPVPPSPRRPLLAPLPSPLLASPSSPRRPSCAGTLPCVRRPSLKRACSSSSPRRCACRGPKPRSPSAMRWPSFAPRRMPPRRPHQVVDAPDDGPPIHRPRRVRSAAAMPSHPRPMRALTQPPLPRLRAPPRRMQLDEGSPGRGGTELAVGRQHQAARNPLPSLAAAAAAAAAAAGVWGQRDPSLRESRRLESRRRRASERSGRREGGLRRIARFDLRVSPLSMLSTR